MKKAHLFLVLLTCMLSEMSYAVVPASWTVNVSSYQYQMTMTCKANEACVVLADTNNYIAAFVGSQCRGVVKTKTAVGSDELGLLNIYSNVVSGEEVTFKIYNAAQDSVVAVLDSVSFSQGAQMGTLYNPVVLHTNHAPTAIAISNDTVTENSPLGLPIATLSATDQDPGTSFAFSLTAGQPENSQFMISNDTLQVDTNFDYEVDSTKLIQITVSDLGGCTYTDTFSIHVHNINEAPDSLKLTSPTVSDHQQANSLMGLFSSYDEDFNDTAIYTLVPGVGDTDNAQFYIQHDTLFNVSQIDYAAQSVYHIRARVTDRGGLYAEDTFKIIVTNVNDAPTDIIMNDTTVDENMPAGTIIDTLKVIDPDPGDTHTLSLVPGPGGADNGLVYFDGDTLKSDTSYDYEVQDSLHLRIMATDSSGATYTKTFVITVNNKNDPPTDISLSYDSVKEGRPVGTLVGLLSTADEDFNSTHVYGLIAGVGDTNNTLFSISGDSLLTAATYYYTGQTYSIRVITTDTGNLSFEKVLSVVVQDSNYVPTDIIASDTSFDENIPIGTTVATLTTIDYDSTDTHTLALVGDSLFPDNTYFKITGDSLETDSAINYEAKNVFHIQIESWDQDSASVTKTFTFTVNDLNEAPTDITLMGDSVDELQPSGTFIGTFSSTDQDAGDIHSYSLVAGAGDSANSMFSISGNQLLSATTYVYSGQSYSIRVRTTDAGGLTYEKVFLIKILNVNEAPTDIILTTTSVNEDNPPMYDVTEIQTVDPDHPDSHTYSLVSGTGDDDNAQFTVEGNQLYINNKTNFDVKDVYHIRLRSQDAGGLSVEKSFDITVNDISGNNIPLPSANYVSPNGDGKNDYWVIQNVAIYKDFSLKIFDQYGHILYSVPNGYHNEWDARLNGTPLPTGNYYYILQKGSKIFRGNITVVN